MAVQYLRAHKVIAEEMIDRTEHTMEALKARNWISKHLGPAPTSWSGVS
jgi:hypothetical protein